MVKKILYVLLIIISFSNHGYSKDSYFTKTEIITNNLYPKSEIVLLVKLYNSVYTNYGAPLTPMIVGQGDYNIHLLSQTYIGETVAFQRKYALTEYKYIIVFDKPGKYQLQSIELSAETKRNISSIEDSYISFVVNPIPKNFVNNFRSATDVKIQDVYSVSENIAYVGDAIRRVVIVNVKGANAKLFRRLSLPDPSGVKVRLGPVKEKETSSNDNINVEWRYNFIYIPNKVGKITVPEYTLRWLNLSTNKIENMVIPEKEFNILPIKDKVATKVDGKNSGFIFTIQHFYSIMALMVFGLFMFMGYDKYKKQFIAYNNKRLVYKDLKNACYKNNPKKTLELSLIALDVMGINNVNNLSEMAELFDDDVLRAQAVLISEAMFKENVFWNGDVYYGVFVNAVDKYKKSINTRRFPKLYPF